MLQATSALLSAVSAYAADVAPYEEVHALRILARVDEDEDGIFEQAEDERKWKQYQQWDANQDGALSMEELKQVPIKYLETGGERKLNVLYKQTAEEDLYLDLYYPTAAHDDTIPVVIYTHGGGWGAGDKQGAANHLYAPLF